MVTKGTPRAMYYYRVTAREFFTKYRLYNGVTLQAVLRGPKVDIKLTEI